MRSGSRGPKQASPPYRSFRLTLILVLSTIAAGFLVRFAPLGLPRGVSKYGGSALWALTIYWLVSSYSSVRQLPRAAGTSGLISAAVEFGKLYHAPKLDAFRLTLPGVLLLGRVFSWWDIFTYGCAIVVGALADGKLFR